MPKYAYFGPLDNPGPEVILRLLDYYGPLGIDTETPSLEDRRLLGVAFAISTDEAFYFPANSEWLPWQLLEDPAREKIFHNSGFDVRVLEDHHGGNFRVTNYKDSLIAARLLGLPGKLSEICLQLFGTPPRPISDLIGEGKNKVTMDKVALEKVAQRACLDAQDALRVWQYVSPKAPVRALDLETKILPLALDIERRGIRIDKEAVHNHRIRLERDVNYFRMICNGMGFNPGSSQQLAAKLEADGIKVIKKRGPDGKIRPRLNKEVLEMFYGQVPYVAITLSYRRGQSLLTHLIKPLDEGEYLTGDRIHPRVHTDIAATGRLSRSSPATQNVTDELRDIFIASEGRELVDWDYSQIELRWAAYLWDDKVMQEIFKGGGDIHAGTAKELEAEGVGSLLGSNPKEMRRTAKDLNFAMLFGGDEHTLWERKRLPLEVGRRLIAAYFSRFKGIANGIEQTRLQALCNGWTATYYGRRRDESERLESGRPQEVAAALRELINHPIQGSAAETMKEAMLATSGAPQVHTVHDEGILDAEPGYQLPAAVEGVAPFPTPVKIKRGKNWKEVA